MVSPRHFTLFSRAIPQIAVHAMTPRIAKGDFRWTFRFHVVRKALSIFITLGAHPQYAVLCVGNEGDLLHGNRRHQVIANKQYPNSPFTPVSKGQSRVS